MLYAADTDVLAVHQGKYVELFTAGILLTLLFIAQSIFHLDVTALLASAGVIGLAAALAAKDTVSNLFGSEYYIYDYFLYYWLNQN